MILVFHAFYVVIIIVFALFRIEFFACIPCFVQDLYSLFEILGLSKVK